VTAPDLARAALVRATWVVLAVVIALGAAGIVAAMDHSPGTPSRAELTWAGDREVIAALAAGAEQLEALEQEVAALGLAARLALAQVIARDLDGVQSTIAAGTARLASVEATAAALRAAAGAVPLGAEDDPLRISSGVRERHGYLLDATGLADDLDAQWEAFTRRALDAVQLAGLLLAHDEHTAAAASEGVAGRYAAALAALDAADATIVRARALRDQLENTTDVADLDEWLDRNADYDAALRTLYTTLDATGGSFSRDVRDAILAEQAARERLPEDTRGLVVIMAEVAEGGLNQVVTAIDDVREELAIAVSLQLEAPAEAP
jgi:hypothetical protein